MAVLITVCSLLGIAWWAIFDNYDKKHRIDTNKYKGIYSNENYYNDDME